MGRPFHHYRGGAGSRSLRQRRPARSRRVLSPKAFARPPRESHVPAICEYLNIPYTGSDPLALALTLHKGRTKEILAYRGVPTAPFRVVARVADLDRLPPPLSLFG